jgi:GNAT superfamily N-acetyltransferase
MAELHFTENYCETALLRDNSRVALRLVRPGDKALLQKGLQRMSPHSRYRRFLAVKNRLSDPDAAEAAIAVVDDWQNKGVGTLLLMRLAGAARERAIGRFRGSVLAQNAPVREILKQLGPSVRTAGSAEELQIEVDLPDVPHDASLGWPEHTTPLRQLLSLTAKGAIFVRRMLSRHESSAQVQG